MDERNVLREIDVMTGEPMGLGPNAVGLRTDVSNDAGEALFVINLCAAMTPINLEAQQLPGLDQYKLYQVSRMEDGRRRYRLRLGFFTSESQAEDVLSSVRSRYATAFTSCLCEEDVKFASGYLKRTVQDIQRTGRFAVTKIRRDVNATASFPALDTATLRTLSAAEATGIHAALPTVEKARGISNAVDQMPPASTAKTAAKVVDNALPRSLKPTSTLPAPKPAAQPKTAAPVSAPAKASPAARQHADSTTIVQRIAVPPAKNIDTTKPLTIADAIAAMGQSAPPKRDSLMRQAHAMADVDAAERAKAVPQTSSDFADDAININAVGAFKTPNYAVADPAKLISKQELKPVSAKLPEARVVVSSAPPTQKQIATAPPAPAPKHSAPQAPHRSQVQAPAVQKTAIDEWEASIPPKHVAKPPVQKPNGAYYVGAGAQIPNVDLTLESLAEAAASPAHKAMPSTTKVSSPIDQSTANDLLLARELAKQSAMWRQENTDGPNLDTTQTIRTLTKTELEDANRDKWFTVQLAISDQPANLDTMPHLDIFEAYTLYSVATMDDGRIRHALRLGFFREEVSAEAVTGYLRTFFAEPVITRIPDAEHERFANAPKRTAPVKTAATVVTLEEKRPAPAAVPTINNAVERAAAPKAASASKPAARQAGVASRSATVATKKSALPRTGKATPSGAQKDMLEEARLLGLSDTQMIRVQKNPSLLARLVGKLGK